MTYIIVGGSSGLGRALAERFAAAGHASVLISSEARDTQALAADIRLRHRIPAVSVALDLTDRRIDFGYIDEALASLPPLAGLLLAAGMNATTDHPGQSQESLDALTTANYTSICKLINHYLPRLHSVPHGLIVGFGSVAATRGRTRNAAYSAAKRALQMYFESLRHALAGSTVAAQFYILGYLDTNLAFGQNTVLPRAQPERLADIVYQRRLDDFGVSYFPRFWFAVCLLLEALPWAIFRRLSF